MGKGIFAFETKATAGLNNVAHKTQVAESAAVGGTAKLEWDPDFKLAGKPLQFTLSANEASVLTGPKTLTGVVASAKIKPTNNSSITGKYAVDKKLPSVSAKLDLYNNRLTANRTLTNELKWAKGAPVALESEIHLNDLTKFQVETLGTKVDAVKLTRKSGSSALKLKYAIQSKAPIIGLDTYRGSQKWDFEYNVKTECLDAKVKVYPMTLAAQTFIGKSGIGKGGISYKITAERTVIF